MNVVAVQRFCCQEDLPIIEIWNGALQISLICMLHAASSSKPIISVVGFVHYYQNSARAKMKLRQLVIQQR